MAIVLGIFNNPEEGGGGSPTVISLLDDFRDMRTNGDGGNLWQPYLGEGNTGQVTTIVSNELRTQTGASPSNYLVQFFPRHPQRVQNRQYPARNLRQGPPGSHAHRSGQPLLPPPQRRDRRRPLV
jgi:hypothetical protein